MGTSLLLATTILVACGGNVSTTIEASSFDQTCSEDSDCVAVVEGTLGCCGASCGAISKKAKSQYEADVTTIYASFVCDGEDCPFTDCSAFPVTCNSGKCAVAKCARNGTTALCMNGQ